MTGIFKGLLSGPAGMEKGEVGRSMNSKVRPHDMVIKVSNEIFHRIGRSHA